MDKLKKILNFAMRLERQGENFYTHYKDLVSNPDTSDLFEKLAEIEKEHYNILKRKLEAIDTDQDLKDISWVVDSHSFIRHPAIFSNQSAQLGDDVPEDEVSDLAIIRMAYSIENDFAEFYAMAASEMTDPEVKTFLETLAKWERGHRTLFYNQYKKLLQNNWSDLDAYIFPPEK